MDPYATASTRTLRTMTPLLLARAIALRGQEKGPGDEAGGQETRQRPANALAVPT
jgi:hypothetical protein